MAPAEELVNSDVKHVILLIVTTFIAGAASNIHFLLAN